MLTTLGAIEKIDMIKNYCTKLIFAGCRAEVDTNFTGCLYEVE